jgi:hypothetical protein
MGKAGTGWLYDTFKYHPDFWMPPIKEIHYLDHRVPKLPGAKRARKSNRRLGLNRERRGKAAYTERDIDFFARTFAARKKPIDYQVYGHFFDLKGEQMSGDVTPGYASMDEDLIEGCMAAFPKLKVVLLVRDPISRAWSHFSMKYRKNKGPRDSYLDPKSLREILSGPNTRATDRPTVAAQTWRRHVPEEQFRWHFFDDLVADPDRVARDLLGFMGADLDKYAKPPDNRKADKAKLELTPEIRDVLIEVFADEMRACADYFGGHAVQWAQKYGISV